jgi:hypothetical protein
MKPVLVRPLLTNTLNGEGRQNSIVRQLSHACSQMLLFGVQKLECKSKDQSFLSQYSAADAPVHIVHGLEWKSQWYSQYHRRFHSTHALNTSTCMHFRELNNS